VRFGAVPAFLLLPFADRIGRRRILLLAIAGMSAGSFATALARSPIEFVLAQILTRTCIAAAAITSFVVVSEEFPALHRGWGIGMLAGVGAIGYGFGALLYGAIEWLPFGWRALYALGVLPLVFLRATRAASARRSASRRSRSARRRRRTRWRGSPRSCASIRGARLRSR
jgi:MFS family permease